MSRQRTIKRTGDRTMFARELRRVEGKRAGAAKTTKKAKGGKAYQRWMNAMMRNARLVTSILMQVAGHVRPHTLTVKVPTRFQEKAEQARLVAQEHAEIAKTEREYARWLGAVERDFPDHHIGDGKTYDFDQCSVQLAGLEITGGAA